MPSGTPHSVDSPTRRLLLIEDDDGLRAAVRQVFARRDWEVSEVRTCADARTRAAAGGFDAIVCDLSLPDGQTLDLLPSFKARTPQAPVVFLTGYGSIDLAVRAMKEGADQFLTKPVDLPRLEALVRRMVEEAMARRPGRELPGAEPPGALDPFVGSSAGIRQLREDAGRVASSDGPVLLTGETGSGKGVLAAWIHAHSGRSTGPYVDLNCAGLARESLESECFGHERGAFTGAATAKPGMFEVADGGTLFLDEIGDTDLDVQAKLLKVIEEKRFRRMGDVRYRTVDVRIIAATHQDLGDRLSRKAFRPDLYFRISTLPLRIPALRERPEDIPELAADLLRRIAEEADRPVSLSAEAMHDLVHYSWPGNIRELRNVLVRAALIAPGETIRRQDVLFDSMVRDPDSPAAGASLEEVERRHIERTLVEEKGNVERAARRLGVSRSTLYEMIRRQGLRRSAD